MSRYRPRHRAGRKPLGWVWRLLWWLIVAGLAVSAAWWLPRVQPPNHDATSAAYAFSAGHARLQPPHLDTTGAGFVLVAGHARLHAEEPTPAPTPEPETPPVTPPEAAGNPIQDFIVNRLTGWIASRLAEALASMAEAVSEQTLSLRPESLSIMDPADPAGFHGLAFGVARAAMLLLITAGAVWVMTHQTLQTKVTIKEIGPRIVVAFAAMEMSMQILSWVVAHTNAVVDAVLVVGFAGVPPSRIADTLREIGDSTTGGDSWMMLTLVLGLLIMLTLLLIGVVTRTLMLMLLAVTGPLALACHALPATEAIARTWWKTLGACVASAIGQALVLVLWFRVFFDGDTRVDNPLNMPESIADYADRLLILALLWLMHKALSVPMRNAFAGTRSVLGPVAKIARSLLMAKTFGLAGAAGHTGARTASAAAAKTGTAASGRLPLAGTAARRHTPGRDARRPPDRGTTGPHARNADENTAGETSRRDAPAGRPPRNRRPGAPTPHPDRPGDPGLARRPFLPPLPPHLRPHHPSIRPAVPPVRPRKGRRS